MENIDDLMRQKFDSDDPGERFEFREEYWEQAQALLEQEEEKKRRWLWWLFGAVLVIGLALWLFWGHGMAGSLSEIKNHPTSSDPSDIQNLHANEKQDEITTNTALNSGHRTDLTDELAGRNMESKSVLGKEDARKSTDNALEYSKAKNQTGASNSITTLFQEKQRQQAPQPSKSTVNGKKEAANQSKLDAVPALPILEGKDIRVAQSTSEHTNTVAVEALSPDSVLDHSTIQELANPKSIQSLINLPTPLILLELPNRIPFKIPLKAISKAPIAQGPKPVPAKPFSFGLVLSGAGYQKSDTAADWVGGTFGVFGRYRLKQNWSLMMGAQWRFVPGYPAPADSINPIAVEQLRYSFGYKQSLWKRETRGVHYLEVPVSVRWQKARFSVEGGVGAGLLLLVQNKTSLTTVSSLEPETTVVNKFVRGNITAYNKGYWSAFAGAEYQFTDRLALMTRVQYRMTPVLKNGFEGVKNKGVGNVELGLRFRMF